MPIVTKQKAKPVSTWGWPQTWEYREFEMEIKLKPRGDFYVQNFLVASGERIGATVLDDPVDGLLWAKQTIDLVYWLASREGITLKQAAVFDAWGDWYDNYNIAVEATRLEGRKPTRANISRELELIRRDCLRRGQSRCNRGFFWWMDLPPAERVELLDYHMRWDRSIPKENPRRKRKRAK